MKLVEHREGGTLLLVPRASLTEVPPPTAPVFYNPAASLNRDVSVAVTAATGGSTFCDSMSGVGARGIRAAKEVERLEQVVLVDLNRSALNVARRSAALNRVRRRCEFAESETSSYLFSKCGKEQRFDHVDVDPFGTPVRQLHGALCATADGGVLSVTATDTAVLCGVYPEVSLRRYGAASMNNHFAHETGIRLLAGAIARQGASLDLAVEPILAHSTMHYVRVFARVKVGASIAEEGMKNIGHLVWCPACGHMASPGATMRACESCGKKVKLAGPLWVGGLADETTVEKAAGAASKRSLSSASTLLESLKGVDSFPPWSFSIERICSELKVPTAPEAAVYRHLVETGHRVMRTPFEKTGLKTDASNEDVVKAVRTAARSSRPR